MPANSQRARFTLLQLRLPASGGEEVGKGRRLGSERRLASGGNHISLEARAKRTLFPGTVNHPSSLTCTPINPAGMSHRPLPSLPSHLRRRSSISGEESVELLGVSPSSNHNARHSFADLSHKSTDSATVIDFDPAGSSGGARPASYYANAELDERGGGGGGESSKAWQDKKQPPRPPQKRPYRGGCIALSLLGIGGAVGWVAGANGGGGAGSAASLSTVRNALQGTSLLTYSQSEG